MRRLVTVLAVMGLALVSCDDGDDTEPAGPTTTTTVVITTTDPVPQQCESIAFTPDSEDAASEVRAFGLPCTEAEAFVRVAGTRTSSGGPEAVDVEGYHCVRTRFVDEPLPRSFYECTNGSKKVTFVRS